MRGIDVSKSKIRSERHCATNVACLLEKAETLGRQGRTAEARTAYTAAVGTDSGHVAQHAWACFLLKEGAIAEAVEQFVALFEIACHADNDDLRASASNNLACAYREWGRYEEAARWQQRSISFWSKIDTATANDPPTADWSNLAIDAINRGDLDMLVHPNTGDGYEDHASNRMWVGSCLDLRLDYLKQLAEKRKVAKAQKAA